MIDAERRSAIWTLFKQGKSKKEIARLLEVDPKTVRRIITSEGKTPTLPRKDKKQPDPVLIENVYKQCQGWGLRTHEVLSEEYGVKLGYSTLTRLIRELELKDSPGKERCGEVPEIKPGWEMQHDTSPFVIPIGGKDTPVQCAGLYYRYSKVRYIKFYRCFNKFVMKSFMYEAVSYLKFVAKTCVIDNTSLAVLRGTGKNAVFHADMNGFAKRLGFDWLAHELNHPNRKAGKERNFRTVVTNFFPGRTFRDMEDLNRQAFEWATDRFFHRPHSKTGLIPAEIWETEKPYLGPLPDFIEPPYRDFDRGTDKYGYAALHANFYWVPGTQRDDVKIIEYPGRIKIFKGREFLIEYPLPPEGVKNKQFKPDGIPAARKPTNNHLSCEIEEGKLRTAGGIVGQYLEFIRSKEGAIKQRNRFVINLYSVYLRVAPSVFLKTIERALAYKINSVEAIERIAVQMMRTDLQEWPEINSPGAFQDRSAYLEGKLSDEPDLFSYGKLLKPSGGHENGSGSENI